MDYYNLLNTNKYIVLEKGEHPLSLVELQALEHLSANVHYESVVNGDAGDTHKLQVGRFRRDIEYPKDLSPFSEKVMEVIESDKMITFHKNITGFDKVCIRRCQSNLLKSGDYVGIHIDGEGDPKYKGTHIDYKYAVVIHFKASYTGGGVIVYPPGNDGGLALDLPDYSMYIITGDLPHEVKEVIKGERLSLVYFLSDNFGKSQ